MREISELVEALRGEPDCPPEISPLSWLRSMIAECNERGPAADNDDPDAFWEMVREVETMHDKASAALSRLTGGQAIPLGSDHPDPPGWSRLDPGECGPGVVSAPVTYGVVSALVTYRRLSDDELRELTRLRPSGE